MPTQTPHARQSAALHQFVTAATLAASLMLGACAQGGLGENSLLSAKNDPPDATTADASGTPPDSRSELEKAVEYWGKAYAKNPRDLNAAVSYARNLKAMNQKGQALNVLQQASMFHPTDRKLASEYGRLALETDQIQMAQSLLEVADDPANPDWRVISARGTVLAKQGKYSEAIPFYERAQTLSAGQPSVLNNLALAYTMSGDAPKAETILREANGKQDADPKVRQNLALVLGLQGKYDEGKRVAAQDIAPEAAAQNADLVRRIVKLDPKSSPVPAATVQTASAKSKSAAPVQPVLKGPTTEQMAATWDSQVATAIDGSPTPTLRPTTR